MNRCFRATLIACTLSIAAAAAQAQHGGDFWVGVTAAGQLDLGGFAFDQLDIVLSPNAQGWSANNPGFDHVVIPDVLGDLYPLASGAQVRLEVVTVDPGISAVTSSFAVLDQPGERALLGGPSLHTHLTWFLNASAPGFQADRIHWSGTFKLVDTGTTGYLDSAPFTLYFTYVDVTLGDVTGDDVVDQFDMPALHSVLANPAGATDEQRAAADVDRDGYVTRADRLALLDLIAGPGPGNPAGLPQRDATSAAAISFRP